MWVDLRSFRHLPKGGLPVEDELRLPLDPVGAPLPGRRAHVADSATVVVRLRGDRHAVYGDVRSEFGLVQPCDRCLRDVGVPVRVRYAEAWVLDGPVDPEQQDDDPSVLTTRVTGDGVDLDDGFWQNVELALPSKVLCRPDCKGLCPRCGADRNEGACACSDEPRDPRWASLDSLRNR